MSDQDIVTAARKLCEVKARFHNLSGTVPILAVTELKDATIALFEACEMPLPRGWERGIK